MSGATSRANEVFIIDAVRTARGKGSKKGSLHHKPALDLTGAVIDAIRARNSIEPSTIDDLILGCASQVDEQGANLARTAALTSGLGDDVPGVTVNRFCASGLEAVAQAGQRIRSGDASVVLAGGVESVSRVPMFSDRGALWADPAVVAKVGSVHMGIAADLVATMEGFGRDELEAYACETQAKAARALEAGVFDHAIVPIEGTNGTPFTRDELVRSTSPEKLASLPPAFAELGAGGQDALVRAAHPDLPAVEHRHTVGTSPALADAAAMLLVASAASAEAAGWAPRARVVGSATAAVDPVIMLTAGQLAVERLLERFELRPADVDVFEFAEAFSALCLRFRRDLDAGPDRLNPHGGTMAMGHAFGATGAILAGACVDELERREGQYGIAAISGAAGLGVAVLLERVTRCNHGGYMT